MRHDEALQRARKSGGLVWHYTTLDTLNTILQTNSLLATEVSFQNDIRETSTADAAFRNALEELLRDDRYGEFARAALRYLDDEDQWRFPPREVTDQLTRNARFILCGSDDPDSLYAWRTYARDGIGCAIGLDPDVPLGIVDPAPPRRHRVRHWRPVVYSGEHIRQISTGRLKRLGEEWLEARGDICSADFYDDSAAVIVLKLADVRSHIRAVAKDPSFHDEREMRVTVDTVSPSALIMTPSNMGPRPHVRLVATDHGPWGRSYAQASEAPQLPIRAIRLGPNAPDSAVASTQWLLLANGYPLDPEYVDPVEAQVLSYENTVIIDESKHPYRSR